MKLSSGLLFVFCMAGCAHFQPKPISPEESAIELETRSLKDAAVKTFLEKNIGREFTNWPQTNWDFDMLLLATFYYQPNLDVARAQWQSAQAGIRTAGARPNPSVSAVAAYNSEIPSVSPWMPSVSFDVPIETAGKRRRRLEQAQHLSESARFKIATTAWLARSELRGALVETISTEQRVQLLVRQTSLQEILREKLRQQFEAGEISAVAALPAGVALARSRADLADAQSQLAEARVRVATAIGIPASALEGIYFDFDLSKNPPTDHLTTADTRRAALLGRADILGALADYAAAQSALQLEIAKQYPDLHLSPGYAWNQNQAGDNQWQLGLTVDLPILNQNQGPIEEAEAHRNELAAKFLALQSKVIGDIDRALAQLDASRRNLEAIRAVAQAQEKQRESVETQFKVGSVEQTDLLSAQLESQSTALVELEAQVRFQQAIGALEDAVQRPIDTMQSSIFEQSPRAKKETRR